mmetsp:Transcript_15377/g.36057  ORF Transcript_15377/g.36057 Transcript_15377/m.36057 type:complete len:223 (+) Transcript_15377:2211-2879(+)
MSVPKSRCVYSTHVPLDVDVSPGDSHKEIDPELRKASHLLSSEKVKPLTPASSRLTCTDTSFSDTSRKSLTLACVAASNKATVRAPATANQRPSCEKATACAGRNPTGSSMRSMTSVASPVTRPTLERSYHSTKASAPPVAKMLSLPRGQKATSSTDLTCPCRVASGISAMVLRFQMRTVRSADADASRKPLGETATAVMLTSCAGCQIMASKPHLGKHVLV